MPTADELRAIAEATDPGPLNEFVAKRAVGADNQVMLQILEELRGIRSILLAQQWGLHSDLGRKVIRDLERTK